MGEDSASHRKSGEVLPSGLGKPPSKERVRGRIGVLLAQHEELDELFLLHQEALLDRDLNRARELLQQYRVLVATHIEEERSELLPIYASFGEAPRGADVELFHSEHEKILARLVQLEHSMERLAARSPQSTRDLIAIFDGESSFKHLMEHHDLRERRFFFPALESWCADS